MAMMETDLTDLEQFAPTFSNPLSLSLAIPLFFRLASDVLPDIGSVGRIGKKNHKKSWNRRPWYPGTTLKVNFHIIGVTKCTICCKKCSCFFDHFFDHFSDRLKELFQMINGLTTLLLFFFLENAKNLGRSDDAKRRKIRGVALDKTSN